MEFDPKSPQTAPEPVEFNEILARKPLKLLRDTERSLRVRAVDTLVPVLPDRVADNLAEVSQLADDSLGQLAEIDLEQITDRDLRPARIRMGLVFVGFGALTVVLMLLYLSTLHPQLTTLEQMHLYWYQYIWFVSLGVAGMFMLGREAMRPRG